MMKRLFFCQILIYTSIFSYGIPLTGNENNEDPQEKNLPIVVTLSNKDKKDPHIALIISGDGGWYKFEQSIADKLAAIGIPTIGLNTKKYFWTRRTPDETAADIAGSINYYCAEWGRNELLLIGYSLGAEIMPFIISRLPEEMKKRISINVLLSPTPMTDFEVHITDMMGIGNKKNTYKVLDELMKIQDVPSLCIFGSEEKTTMPDNLKGTTVRVATIPGDHHYNFNTSLIVQTIKNSGGF